MVRLLAGVLILFAVQVAHAEPANPHESQEKEKSVLRPEAEAKAPVKRKDGPLDVSAYGDSRLHCFKQVLNRILEKSRYRSHLSLGKFEPGGLFGRNSFLLELPDGGNTGYNLNFSASWDNRRQTCRLNSADIDSNGSPILQFRWRVIHGHHHYTLNEAENWNRRIMETTAGGQLRGYR